MLSPAQVSRYSNVDLARLYLPYAQGVVLDSQRILDSSNTVAPPRLWHLRWVVLAHAYTFKLGAIPDEINGKQVSSASIKHSRSRSNGSTRKVSPPPKSKTGNAA